MARSRRQRHCNHRILDIQCLRQPAIKAIHVTELRTALSEAMTVAGAEIPPFDPITPHVTLVRFIDVFQILQLAD